MSAGEYTTTAASNTGDHWLPGVNQFMPTNLNPIRVIVPRVLPQPLSPITITPNSNNNPMDLFADDGKLRSKPCAVGTLLVEHHQKCCNFDCECECHLSP